MLLLAPRAKRVLKRAAEEADRGRHGRVGDVHLPFGIVAEKESVAAGVLAQVGVVNSPAFQARSDRAARRPGALDRLASAAGQATRQTGCWWASRGLALSGPQRAWLRSRMVFAQQSRRPVAIVADDDASIRALLEELLGTQLGYRVVAVADGLAALAALRQETPDVVLLDYRMPGVDGYEVARRVRADPRTRAVRVVCISAHGDPTSAIEAGCTSFLAKPFDLDGVIALLGAAPTQGPSRPSDPDRSDAG